jgi:methyl-accepting chemotaxis protein
MSLKAKFRIMVAAAAAGLVIVAGFWISNQHSVLLSEKMKKAASLIDVPYSVIAEQQQLESAGKISRAEAQAHALEAIRSMRYEGANYFWINDEHPTMIMHPLKPELNGKDLSSFKDPAGKLLFVECVEAARAPEGGYVFYLWPKPGKDKPVSKLSFVKAFAPWGWVIGTGIYIDDVEAAWRTSALKAGGLALACLVPLLAVSTATSRSITGATARMVALIGELAAHNLAVDDLAITSGDELGKAGEALNRMKNHLRTTIQSIAVTAQHVATASEELSSTSQQISANSEETSAQANVVTQAVQQVNQNLQSVSTGGEEMTSTIQSIATNAHEAATIASNAVQTAQAANATVGKLGDSSREIGEVIKVITSIAQQTNLLALNATIEAARAGEAGKGFAVVANEVKELAKQTAKATEDISRKIGTIQTDTKGAVEAIGTITGIIGQINDISGTIATAVEEQSATTNEMTRNVADAAKGSGEITHNIAGVAEAARGTSNSASESLKASNELAGMAAELHNLVAQFKIDGGPARRAKAESIAVPSRSAAAHAG